MNDTWTVPSGAVGVNVAEAVMPVADPSLLRMSSPDTVYSTPGMRCWYAIVSVAVPPFQGSVWSPSAASTSVVPITGGTASPTHSAVALAVETAPAGATRAMVCEWAASLGVPPGVVGTETIRPPTVVPSAVAVTVALPLVFASRRSR